MIGGPTRREVLCGVAASGIAGCVTFSDTPDNPDCTQESPTVDGVHEAPADAWPTAGYDPANTAWNPDAAVPDLRTALVEWIASFEASEIGQPLVLDGTTYVRVGYRRFVALNLTTGERHWSFGGPDADQVLDYGLADGTAYVGRFREGDEESNRLVAIDRATGEQRWRTATAALPAEGVAATESAVYVGTTGVSGRERGFVHAIDPDDGEEDWRTALDDDVVTRPAVAEDLLFVGADFDLTAVDRANGGPCWTVDLGILPWRVAAAHGRVYVAGEIAASQTLIRLDVLAGEDGSLHWRSNDVLPRAPGVAVNGLAVTDDRVMVGTTGGVYSLGTDGSVSWQWERPSVYDNWWFNALVVTGDRVLTDGPDGIHALDADTGDLVGTVPIDGFVTGVTVASGTILVAVRDRDRCRLLAVR